MTPELLDKAIDDLLERLLDLPPDKQQAILNEHRASRPEVCARAETILAKRSTGIIAGHCPATVTSLNPMKFEFTERTGERTKPDIPEFEILAELGRGGMGAVFKARQIKLTESWR